MAKQNIEEPRNLYEAKERLQKQVICCVDMAQILGNHEQILTGPLLAMARKETLTELLPTAFKMAHKFYDVLQDAIVYIRNLEDVIIDQKRQTEEMERVNKQNVNVIELLQDEVKNHVPQKREWRPVSEAIPGTMYWVANIAKARVCRAFIARDGRWLSVEDEDSSINPDLFLPFDIPPVPGAEEGY